MTTIPPLPEGLPPSPALRFRVQARVALVLLETLRSQDIPPEVLDDEDVVLTLPRRFGLSDVIESQIRRYRQDARRRRRLPGSEVLDLMRMVVRRPDSEEIFERAGRALAAANGAPGWRRRYPRRLAYALARRRVRTTLLALFGGRVVRSAGAPFSFEAAGDLLIVGDPGGDACAIVTGMSQAVLEAYAPDGPPVAHVRCRGRGGDSCHWALESVLPA